MTPSQLLDESVWPGIVVASWGAFVQLAAETDSQRGPGRLILFRGQSQQWRLFPNLLRPMRGVVSLGMAVKAERAALAHFQSQAHLHYPPSGLALPARENALGDWWGLMQHHNAPTRLLDWTASPYVAAYFAAEKDYDEDGAIVVIDAGPLTSGDGRPSPQEALTDGYMFQHNPPNELFAFTPFSKTPRLVAQQGYFTVSSTPLGGHDDLLASSGAIVRRWVIPKTLKATLMHHLRAMNVAAHTLFPGLDGLGRSASELIRSEATDR